MNVLHVASEYLGLAKTGGLADVCQALPTALAEQDVVTRLCLPAYRGTIQHLRDIETIAVLSVRGEQFRVLAGRLPGANHSLLLFDCPRLFDRPGDPYRNEQGIEFADNGWRFGCFCEAVSRLITEQHIDVPDIVHLHDWQAGLIAGWLRDHGVPSRILFTIHNLAYQGVFDAQLFSALGLPETWWIAQGVEQLGSFSFMKAGIHFSHAISTVSPSYAREICTVEQGFGLHEALQRRRNKLHGILNGINTDIWNPARDPCLPVRYDVDTAHEAKAENRKHLQAQLRLQASNWPLLLFIGRLAAQKGVDLLLAARSQLSRLPLQIVLLGTGEADLERACQDWARSRPGQVCVILEVNEELAHRLTAAADLQIMPSRFEPCGLNQMYAQAYGTLPIVRRTGGLADTVVNATPTTLHAHQATGVHFEHADAGGVLYGVHRGLELMPARTRLPMQQAGMTKDFSWRTSAARYLNLYHELCS